MKLGAKLMQTNLKFKFSLKRKMNKNRGVEVKKSLVRNSEQTLPKEANVLSSKVSVSSRVNLVDPRRHSSSKISHSQPSKSVVFNVPQLHSTLKLSKKIDEVIQPQKTKSLSEFDKKPLAVDEKVTRKVNFPYGHSVFKDLIPLTNAEVKAQPSVALKVSSYQKDREPVLSDYLEPRKSKVYYCQPRLNMKNSEDKINDLPINGMKLYQILLVHENVLN